MNSPPVVAAMNAPATVARTRTVSQPILRRVFFVVIERVGVSFARRSGRPRRPRWRKTTTRRSLCPRNKRSASSGCRCRRRPDTATRPGRKIRVRSLSAPARRRAMRAQRAEMKKGAVSFLDFSFHFVAGFFPGLPAPGHVAHVGEAFLLQHAGRETRAISAVAIDRGRFLLSRISPPSSRISGRNK